MGNSRGTVFLIGAAASTWLIYDMATASEAPSATLAAMKYLILAVVVGATLYTGAKWFANPPPEQPKAPPPAKSRAARRRTAKR